MTTKEKQQEAKPMSSEARPEGEAVSRCQRQVHQVQVGDIR